MLNKILRWLFTIIGLALGYIIGGLIMSTNYFSSLSYFNGSQVKSAFFLILCSIVFGIILFLISPWINSIILKIMDYIVRSL